MASNLLTNPAGREALRRGACWLAARRIGRKFRKSWFRAWWDRFHGVTPAFSYETMLGEFNEVLDADILNYSALISELGCSGATDMIYTIYVDAINGSDSTGYGTATAPYASFNFLKWLPRRIDHAVRIVLLSDVEIDDLVLNLDIGAYGSFAIIGQAAPVVNHPAQTITATGPCDGVSPASRTQTVAGAGWTNDQWIGSWIKWTAGTGVGLAGPIHRNFGTTLSHLDFDAGAAHTPAVDEFETISPRWTLTANSLTINARSNVSVGAGSKVFIGNLNIDITASDKSYYPIQINANCHFMMSFCRVLHVSNQGPIGISCYGLNSDAARDGDLATLSQCGLLNFSDPLTGTCCGLKLFNTDGPAGNDLSAYLWKESYVYAVDTRGRISLQDATLYYSACSQIWAYSEAILSRIHLNGYANEECYRQIGGNSHLTASHFSGVLPVGNPTDCIRMESGLLRCLQLTAPATSPFSGHGINMIGFASVHTESSLAAITGSTPGNDISFAIIGTVAHPAANLSTVSDFVAGTPDVYNGSWVAWITVP